ncbi:Beta-glucanase, GH16 family [Amycolatopsis xylanica]|uniref:Beta-glucanase, GH16 family n=2 Tax=Amycolatopsis xylanica TaxID=589385 RepID=A0A1H2Y375_9PSEU|nr:Beta-glucanase, GH16 family [Amycolatopsis xylanica]
MMSTRLGRFGLLLATAALLVPTITTTITTAASAGPAAIEAATFTDDFNGPANSGIDGSKWQFETGDNVNNHERQWYTSGTNNAKLDGQGNLVITAKKENPGNYNCWYGRCEYTSARLSTASKFTQTYGRYEARMKLPRGQGMWPAFWMLGNDIGSVGWPNSGEIDIMENVGFEPNTVHGTLHGPGYSGSGGIGAGYSGPNFSDGFHTFAIDWAPNKITWSVDGNVYQTRTPADLNGNRWVFDHPFYIILNLAVGGYWPGDPNGSTVFPQQLVVDYVHVTTSNTGSGNTGPITGLAGKCVDVAGANSANGTAVQLYDCNGTGAQQWTVGGGAVKALGKCLDVTSAGTANGTPIQLYDCNGSGAQQWTANGSKQLVNSGSGRCLDVTGNNSANGTRLQIWDCGGGANQQWNVPGASLAKTESVQAGPTAAQLLAKVSSCQQISNGKYATDEGGAATIPVCKTGSAVHFTGDLDIDCDGVRTTQCNENTDCCFYNDTAFHTSTDQPLNAAQLPYVVLPQPSGTWDYRSQGIDGGDVVAVIYNNKVEYAVVGDTGPAGIAGEASYATAVDLGINPDPKNGGTAGPVTYIVFPGSRVNPIEDHGRAVSVGEQAASQFVGGGTPPSGGVGQITGYGGKCVDVAGANSANGTAVQLYDCNGTNAQQWTVGGGAVKALGKCLAVPGTANGTQAQITTCDGSGGQQWTANSSQQLVNSGSGKCLDATGVSSANGTRLQIWTCGSGANQKWTVPSA